MNPSQLRNIACELAPSDSARALATARSIKDAWYASQALAWVARYASDAEFAGIIKESLNVVRGDRDPFRIVAPAAWPIRAVVERERLEMLRSIVPGPQTLASRRGIAAPRSTPLINWRQRRNLLDTVMCARRRRRAGLGDHEFCGRFEVED